jgi:hypothetical protein
VRLHGLLLAFGWLAQNTGHTAPGRPGILAAGYKATAEGVRARKRAGTAAADGGEADTAEVAPDARDDAIMPRRRTRRCPAGSR